MRYALIVVAALLAGCVAAPSELKAIPDSQSTFSVAESYQLVLKRIVEQHRECMPTAAGLFTTINLDVQHYPDLREATVTRSLVGGGTLLTLLLEVREAGPKSATVTMWQRARFGKEAEAEKYRRWANGDKAC